MRKYDPADNMKKIFVGALHFKTTEEAVQEHFGKFGEILDCFLMKDQNTGKSRGFAFVTYNTEEGCDEAMANRPHNIDGRKLEVKRAVPREEVGNPEANISSKKLFVAGIKDDVEEETMKDYFGQFGKVVHVNFVTDKESGRRRGFGFVEFDDYDPVDKILLIKNHNLMGKPVNIRKGLEKDAVQNIRGGGRGGARGGGRGGGRGGYDGGYGGAQGYDGGQAAAATGGWQGYGGDQYAQAGGGYGGQDQWGAGAQQDGWGQGGYAGAQQGYGQTGAYGADNGYGGGYGNNYGNVASGYLQQGAAAGGPMRGGATGGGYGRGATRSTPYGRGGGRGRGGY